MSLHSFQIHKNEQKRLITDSLPEKNMSVTSTCSPVQNINYLNNVNISYFFKNYESISSIFFWNLTNSLEYHQHNQIATYQRRWSNKIKEIDDAIVFAKKVINANPNLAIDMIETMLNKIGAELKEYPECNIGSNAVKVVLVKLSADIQIVKNEINYELDEVNSSSTRLTASPIYISM